MNLKDFAVRGTIYPSFQLGIGGPTLHQGTSAPNPGDGIDGDVFFIVNGPSSGILQKSGGVWGAVAGGGAASIGAISPVSDAFIVGNGTIWVGKVGNDVKKSFSLGTEDIAEFAGVTVSPSISYSSKEFVLFGLTTDNTQTELFLDNINTQALVPSDSTWLFEIKLSARRTDSANESNIYWFSGACDRQSLINSIQLIGIIDSSEIIQSANWLVDVSVDTSTAALSVKVTGENGKTIKWAAGIKVTEVKN